MVTRWYKNKTSRIFSVFDNYQIIIQYHCWFCHFFNEKCFGIYHKYQSITKALTMCSCITDWLIMKFMSWRPSTGTHQDYWWPHYTIPLLRCQKRITLVWIIWRRYFHIQISVYSTSLHKFFFFIFQNINS